MQEEIFFCYSPLDGIYNLKETKKVSLENQGRSCGLGTCPCVFLFRFWLDRDGIRMTCRPGIFMLPRGRGSACEAGSAEDSFCRLPSARAGEENGAHRRRSDGTLRKQKKFF